MSAGEWIRGKWQAARFFARLAPHVTNLRDIRLHLRTNTPITRLAMRGGFTLHARPEDQAFLPFLEIVVDRCYTRPTFYAPKGGHTVVDLGANIGALVLECARRASGVRVVAAEPNPGTFTQLRHNIAANALGDRVTALPLAVSDRPGRLHLAHGDALSGHQQLSSEGTGPGIEAVTLDELYARGNVEHCDLLKIDTEGAELAIVEGATDAVWRRTDRIVIEYHEWIPQPGAGRLAERLGAAGFIVRDEPLGSVANRGLLYAWKPGCASLAPRAP